MSVNRIDIKEFRKKGFLFEANRKFFHPLGLALEVIIDEKGEEKLGGIWDYRDDPEGILYGGDTSMKENANIITYVDDLRISKLHARALTGMCNSNGIQIKDEEEKTNE